MTQRLAPLTLALAVLALVPGCVEEETPATYGNLFLTCAANTSCDCNVTGNCFIDCPGGGCDLGCNAMSNCFFSCGESGGAGGCTITCANMGNCETACDGGDCAMTCTGTNNGIVSGSGCTATRTTGVGTCIVVP